MINKLCIIAGALVLAVLSESAAAQSNFYIFVTLGNTDSDVSLGGFNRVDDDNSSYALGAGFAINQNVSLEAAYKDFGTSYAETDCPPGFTCLVVPLVTQADVTGISLSLIGSYPLTDRMDVYGKVGLVSWDIEYEGISAALDTSGEDLQYGAGLRWSIADHWKVFVEYGKVELDLDTPAIGVSYRF